MNRKTKSKKRPLFRHIIMLCLLSVFICGISPSAFATAKIDGDKPCSLTLNCIYNGKALSGMHFRLYRVADASDTAVFSLSGDFKNYKVSLKNLDASGWKAAADTLATYIKPDNIQALKAEAADSNGRINFGTLSTGLYLVAGESVIVGSTIYKTAPFLVSLPSLQKEDTWTYAVTVIPKISPNSKDTNPTTRTKSNGKVNVTLLKVWNDDGDKNEGHASIEVTLLQNGSIYDTYTLTADNYWRHTWSGLKDDCDWTAIENKVPESYTVTYNINQTVITITNTYTQEIPDDPIPIANIVGDDDKTKETLPQTGMLWWPVHVMAALGIILFGMGWWKRSGQREKKDEK